jgi:4-hydroxybenzoate polyprenyltransferase
MSFLSRSGSVAARGAAEARPLRDALRLLRPQHWVKNAFVLLPVPFALAAGSHLDLPVLLAGLAGFCLLSSAVYAVNDVMDAEADRRSPRKRSRPVASGAIPVPAALAIGAALLAAAGLLAAATGLATVWVLFAVYAAANAVYSGGAKHVPLVDVFLLASGFVIRVLLGCALLEAPPSQWLLLCSSALALFLAFAKRRGDIVEGVGREHRPALAGYSQSYLDAAMGICAGIALLAYALYCGEAQVLLPGREFVSLVFAAFGILEYLRLASAQGKGAAPVEVLLRSRRLQVCGACWAAAVAFSLGLF